jgi:hypothetical protein
MLYIVVTAICIDRSRTCKTLDSFYAHTETTTPLHAKQLLTFCWRHSLQARFTAVLRRDDDEGRVSPSPFSSSSLDADRLNPRCVLVGLAKGCGRPCNTGVVGDMECNMLLDIFSDRYRREFRLSSEVEVGVLESEAAASRSLGHTNEEYSPAAPRL